MDLLRWRSFYSIMTTIQKAATLQFHDKILIFMNCSWENWRESAILDGIFRYIRWKSRKTNDWNWTNHTGDAWIYISLQNCEHDSRRCENRQVIVLRREWATENANESGIMLLDGILSINWNRKIAYNRISTYGILQWVTMNDSITVIPRKSVRIQCMGLTLIEIHLFGKSNEIPEMFMCVSDHFVYSVNYIFSIISLHSCVSSSKSRLALISYRKRKKLFIIEISQKWITLIWRTWAVSEQQKYAQQQRTVVPAMRGIF